MKKTILRGIVTAAACLAIVALSSHAFGGDDSLKEQLKGMVFSAYDQKELIVVHDKLRVTRLGRTNGADSNDFGIIYRYIDKLPRKEWGPYKKFPTIDDSTSEQIYAEVLIRDLLKPGEKLQVRKFYFEATRNWTKLNFFLVALDSGRAANTVDEDGYATKADFGCRFEFYFWELKKDDDPKVLFDGMVKAVQQYLLTEDEARAQNVAAAAAVEAKKNVSIEPGMSKEEAIKVLGEPVKTITFGDKTILKYEDMTVELREGKVVDVKSD